MSREFKFRVWYIQQEKYEYVKSFHDFKDMSYPFTWCEIHQYTGLKDKNKKEIYEGDIVKFKYWVGDFAWEEMDDEEREINSEMENKEYIGVVKEKMLEPCNLELVAGNMFFPLLYVSSGEVIGNIYENPELLKNE